MSWVFGGTIICLILVLFIPFLQNLFKFGTVPFIDLIVCAVAGGLSVMWFEGYKYWSTRTVERG